MQLVSQSQLDVLEAHLRTVLSRLLAAQDLYELNARIRAYVLAGGKRVRPQLCIWTCQRLSGKSSDSLMDVACAWELFHAFLLIHDDIIDASDRRREQKSLHRQLESLDGNSPKFGMNLAIVAGDLLFSAAMRLLHELDTPAEVYRDLLRLFSRVACTTGFGQAIDICQSHVPLAEVSEQTILREYHWKTAAYTFEGPMLSGAILAGADPESQQAISKFALALGQAYQLQNDLIDLAGDVHGGCDIAQGKRTVTLAKARSAMDPIQRSEFDRRFDAIRSANGHQLTLADQLRRELRNSDAPKHTQKLVDEFLAAADHAADDPALHEDLSSGLKSLLNSLRQNYFVTL